MDVWMFSIEFENKNGLALVGKNSVLAKFLTKGSLLFGFETAIEIQLLIPGI